jgi:hypothetical protein
MADPRLMAGGQDAQRLMDLIQQDGTAALNPRATKAYTSRYKNAIYEYYISNLLSGPKTQIVNTASNAGKLLFHIAKRPMEIRFNRMLWDEGKDQYTEGETAALIFGMIGGIKDGWRVLSDGLRMEDMDRVRLRAIDPRLPGGSKIETTETNSISSQAFGLKRRVTAKTQAKEAARLKYGQDITGEVEGEGLTIGKAMSALDAPEGKVPVTAENIVAWHLDYLGSAVRIPNRVLGSVDGFFKAVNYRMELHAQAYRIAKNEGLEGDALATRVHAIIENPPDEIGQRASDVAHMNTFTTELGPMGRKRQAVINDSMALRVLLPFIRTPTNLAKDALNHTPLAVVNPNFIRGLKTGGEDATRRTASLASGSMAAFVVAGMVAEGRITGAGPPDRSSRMYRNANGIPSFGIQGYDPTTGEPMWFKYDRTDPFGLSMGVMATAAELMGHVSEEDAVTIGQLVTYGFTQSMLSKTYVRSMADLVKVAYGQADAGHWAADRVTGLLPFSSLMRQTKLPARVGEVLAGGDFTDPKFEKARQGRSATTDPEFAKGKEQWTEQQKQLWLGIEESISRIAVGYGYGQDLPVRHDELGNELGPKHGYPGTLGTAINMLSPIAASVDENDPLYNVLQATKPGGFGNISDTIRAPGRVAAAVKMHAEAFERYKFLSGQDFQARMRPVAAGWVAEDMVQGVASWQSEFLEDQIRKSRDMAKKIIFQEYPELLSLSIEKGQKQLERFAGE